MFLRKGLVHILAACFATATEAAAAASSSLQLDESSLFQPALHLSRVAPKAPSEQQTLSVSAELASAHRPVDAAPSKNDIIGNSALEEMTGAAVAATSKTAVAASAAAGKTAQKSQVAGVREPPRAVFGHSQQAVVPGLAVGTGLLLCLGFVASLGWVRAGNAGGALEATEDAYRNSHDLRMVQASCLLGVVLVMSAFTALIPESYNLSRDLGFGATESGLLVGGYMALRGLAAIGAKVLTQAYSGFTVKVVIVMACCVQLACFLVFGLAADPPDVFEGVTDTQRFGCLMACRLLMGICVGICIPTLNILAVRAIPNSQMVRFTILKQCASTVGIGLGPLLSAIAVRSAGAVDVSTRGAAASYIFVVPWLAFTAASMFIPFDISHLVAAKAAADAVADAAKGEDAHSPSGATAVASMEVRRAVWMKGQLYGVERAFFVSALEVATALVLENEFGWTTESIGIAIGATFLMSLPLTTLVEGVRHRGWATDLQIMSSSACVCALSSILFFPRLGTVMGLPEHINAGLILMADCFIFSSGYLANGIIDGFGVRSSIPGSAYTTENYVVVSNVAQSVSRFLGPPFARAVLSACGRSVYAGCQLSLATLGCVTCLSVTTALRHVTDKHVH